MIELRTLGLLDLRGADGREIRAVLTQPKRVALLAYLALAQPRGFHRRDTLLGLLWPDSDHEHARAALRKALFMLREALGEGVVVSRGDEELGVDDTQLRCDAVAFEQALADGRRAEAFDLYQGDLLPGFFIDRAAEFERWLEEDRARLRERAAAAAWGLAEDAEGRGHDMVALQWARRAAGLSPNDEGAVRRLIALLDRIGDRAGALHVYEEFTQQLAKDYEAEPSAKTKSLIDAVRLRVDRISGDFADRNAAVGHEPRRVPPVRLPPAAPRRRALVGLAAGLLLVFGFAAWQAARWLHARPSRTAFGRAAQLVFAQQPPASVQANVPAFPPLQVALKDALGHIVPTGPVTLALGSAPWPGAALSGTLTVGAANGMATFGGLSIDKPGVGYTLFATSGTARGVSAPFRVGITFASVGAFWRQSCGVTSGNDVYCWGNNASGQLGGSVGALDSVPALAGAGLHFTQVTGGGDHTCGLATGGAVYCWGRNHVGQLGNTTTTPSSVPVHVQGSGTGALIFHQVSAGAHHVCGIATGNALFCWGTDGSGQMSAAATEVCEGTRCSTSPVLVATPPGTTFTAVSGGGDHTCAITTAGTLYCWGYNDHGQLGDNRTTRRDTPTAVPGPEGGEALAFATVSAGLQHTCGVTTDGAAYCWGANDYGQLGDGSTTERHAPVAVGGPSGARLSFAAVSAGGSHTCGITRAGPAYCWGRNSDGELGDGTTVERHTPVLVGGSVSVGWSQVSAGDRHSCGRRSAGGGNLVYCWGSNELGQLGDGTLNARRQPARVVQ